MGSAWSPPGPLSFRVGGAFVSLVGRFLREGLPVGTLCIDPAGLELPGVFFLPLLPRCRDCSQVSPHLVLLFLFRETAEPLP